ncbi:hypothetical protein IU450_35975 [Nocardia abscessus]|uniref:hypothetical protein n=1 Tax=Nocardia abscessus TaxID=120957 RepID=UPI001893E6FD|nr:hypothetical protein [Nocardia abscessus]MBF6341240.1 hypothetical protein [Nocardia abscessus]
MDPVSKAAACEGDHNDPEQANRVRPVRRLYNLLNQRTVEHLGYYRDGRTSWAGRLAEWEVFAVDGFGDGVHMIRSTARPPKSLPVPAATVRP